jgi:hypothetical protein
MDNKFHLSPLKEVTITKYKTLNNKIEIQKKDRLNKTTPRSQDPTRELTELRVSLLHPKTPMKQLR